MTYELKIDLVGADQAASILKSLSGMSSALGKGTSSSPIKDALEKPIEQATQKLSKFKAALKEMTEKWRSDMKAIGTNIEISGTGTGRRRKNPFQKESDEFGNGGLATTPNMNAPEDEAKREKDASDKARRAEVAFDARKKLAALRLAKQQDDLKFYKDMSLLQLPLMRPGSPWGIAFASRSISGAMLGTEKGRGLMGTMGMSGAGGAMVATAALVAASTVAGLALKGLAFAVEEVIKSIENARQLYAKALTGGMGLQWTSQRSMMAEIMGVSETEVFRFGSQMAYLNPRLQQASQILAKTARPLTQVSWEFKILGKDLEALFSQLAQLAAPAIYAVTNALDSLVKTASWFIKNAPELATLGLSHATGLPTRTIVGLGTYGIVGILSKMGILQYLNGKMPDPQAWMKQLPASSIEHMGFITGGGGMNYQRQIAQNTHQMARDIGYIANHYRSQSSGNRGAWGTSRNGNQP